MTKTREQVEATLATELAKLQKQQAKVNRLGQLIRKMAESDAAAIPMTLAHALETFLNDGRTEFEKGRDYLQDLTWKGAWKGTGLQHMGSYWPGSRQRVLQLALNYTWDAAKLDALEALLLTVLPSMKTGNYDMSRQGFDGDAMIGSWDKKVEQVDGQTLKIFNIFEHDLSAGGDYALGVLEDGTALVYDQRRMSYGQQFRGTLRECLEYVRANLWYEGGPSSDDDDCRC